MWSICSNPSRNADEVCRFTCCGVNAGNESLKVRHLRHLGREPITDLCMGVERIDGIKAGINLRGVHERVTNPLLEHALPEWCDTTIENLEKGAFDSSIKAVGEYLEVDQGLAIKDEDWLI